VSRRTDARTLRLARPRVSASAFPHPARGDTGLVNGNGIALCGTGQRLPERPDPLPHHQFSRHRRVLYLVDKTEG
jgi:hypothetical protein